MLLSMCAFGLGCLVGRARGGRWLGVTQTRLHAQASLIIGITTVLVLNLIGPAFPIGWLIIGYACFFHFGVRNLQITGMIVLLIGLAMNLAAALANGAVPVSERALQSVGATNTGGIAVIEGVRESTETATTLTALGDVVPVPLFNVVVSLGDLIMLVALVDIAANLMLRARARKPDEAGFTYASDSEAPEDNAAANTPPRIPILSPLSIGFTSRPQHALHRRPRLRAATHSAHVPAHAAEPVDEMSDDQTVVDDKIVAIEPTQPATEANPSVDPAASTSSEPVIVLDDDEAYIEQPPPPTSATDDQVEIAVVTPGPVATDPAVDLRGRTDRRPIIDLTTSPTDEQLCEFLRRRDAADEQLRKLAPPSPGHRRHRGRLRRQRRTTTDDFAETLG